MKNAMTLILVEVPDELTVEMLRQQKNVHIVGIIAQPVLTDLSPAAEVRPKRKWAGSLSDAAADSLRAHTEQVRSEWERNS